MMSAVIGIRGGRSETGKGADQKYGAFSKIAVVKPLPCLDKDLQNVYYPDDEHQVTKRSPPEAIVIGEVEYQR